MMGGVELTLCGRNQQAKQQCSDEADPVAVGATLSVASHT
jgi:hypothetical protein